MSAPDGLEALQAQRAKASARHAPPPRHTAPAKPPASPVVDAPSFSGRAAAQSAEAGAVGALIRASIYLDVEADGFLEDVRTAGRRATPKVDASRSAVVRLALLRLADELGPAEIVAELSRRSATAAVSPGRKRL